LTTSTAQAACKIDHSQLDKTMPLHIFKHAHLSLSNGTIAIIFTMKNTTFSKRKISSNG